VVLGHDNDGRCWHVTATPCGAIKVVTFRSVLATIVNRAIRDVIGKRGELIVELRLSDYANFPAPLFSTTHLGQKWQLWISMSNWPPSRAKGHSFSLRPNRPPPHVREQIFGYLRRSRTLNGFSKYLPRLIFSEFTNRQKECLFERFIRGAQSRRSPAFPWRMS
jgi:hypothetical protein